MKTRVDNAFIHGIDDDYLAGVKRWQDKAEQDRMKKVAAEKKTEEKRMKSLTKCKTCGKEVAKTAKKCPHCGAKLKWGFFEKLVAAVVIAPVALMIIGQLNGPYVPKHDAAEAQVTVRHAIVSRLKDPDSYKELQNRVVEENGNKMVVIEYTATNSFNARVRNAAIGIVDQNGKLISFKADK